ncbi:MAG: hypothetical protein HUJ60_00410 [Bacilli bacterium]|nr:hypothetical protein [Bacilli bacterium]
MLDYFNYLRETIVAFFTNLGLWFSDRYAYPWARVPGEFKNYGDIFNAYSGGFGFFGWFFFILFAILLVVFLATLVYLLVVLIRRYAKFYKSELDKEKLRREIEKLNLELYNTTMEKDRILGLQLNAAGLDVATPIGEGGPEGIGEDEKDTGPALGRFPRMLQVDAKYEESPFVSSMTPEMELSLEDICKRFRLFAASQLGLYYTIDTIRAFFAGMGTGKVIILEGISGTGKTSLPYALGRFFQNPAIICSVQPSWHDRSELLGYYNAFTKKFTETEFLRAVYEATFRGDINIIVLDEMNLARIEYYFAEFLSIMEMPNVAEWNIDIIAEPLSDDPVHIREGKLLIPQNIWFVGTANNDDSTFTITDKVYDRAMSLFFDNKGRPFDFDFAESLPLSYEYLEKAFAQAQTNFPISESTMARFSQLDDFVIENFKLAFGNRILKQMRAFVPCYVACGGTELAAVDYIFCTKILKKFEVLNIAFLRDELNALDAKLTKLFGRNEFQMSRNKIRLLLKMNG